MIGSKRLANLRELVEDTLFNGVPGDFIETGVWRGGSCILMRAVLYAHNITDRNVWVADSFEGLPPASERQYPADKGSDFHTYSQLAVPLEEVQANFRHYGLLDEQTRFLKGWFKDTLPSVTADQFALIRLDGDMYESTMDALTHLYPKLSANGYAIIDDYHVVAACKAAVHDYCDQNKIDPVIIEIDGVGVYWRKTSIGSRIHPNGTHLPLVDRPIENQIFRLNNSIRELEGTLISRLGESLIDKDSELAKLHAEIRRHTEQNANVRARNDELSAEMALLHSSVSWRVTKPLRTVKKLFRSRP